MSEAQERKEETAVIGNGPTRNGTHTTDQEERS